MYECKYTERNVNLKVSSGPGGIPEPRHGQPCGS